MANQPQNTPKGQMSFNTGAKPPAKVITKPAGLKGMQHTRKMDKHNGNVRGQSA